METQAIQKSIFKLLELILRSKLSYSVQFQDESRSVEKILHGLGQGNL